MDNKDVEGALDWFIKITSEMADALVYFLDLIPDVIKGAVIFALAFIWVWKRVTR